MDASRPSPSGLAPRARLRHRWGRAAGKWIWWQGMVLWGLAQALPVDVLDQFPMLRRITGPIVAAIPSAASLVARTEFAQVAEVMLSLGWLLVPLNVLFGLLLPEHLLRTKPRRMFGELDDLRPAGTNSTAFWFAGVFLLAALPWLLWTLLAVPVFASGYADNDMALFAYTHRAGLGLTAQIASNLQGILVATWVVMAGHYAGSFVAFWRRQP